MDAHTLHLRLGHCSRNTLEKVARLYNITLTHRSNSPCLVCAESNIHHAPVRAGAHLSRSKLPGEGWSLDVFGPLRILTLGGYKYFLLAIDDASRLARIWLLRSRESTLQLQCLKALLAWVWTQTGRRVKFIRTDGEWISTEFKQFQQEYGFEHLRTTRATPTANAIVERHGGILMAMARAMMIYSSAPAFLFGYAVEYAVYLHNRLPKTALHDYSPENVFRNDLLIQSSTTGPRNQLLKFARNCYNDQSVAGRRSKLTGPHSDALIKTNKNPEINTDVHPNPSSSSTQQGGMNLDCSYSTSAQSVQAGQVEVQPFRKSDRRNSTSNTILHLRVFGSVCVFRVDHRIPAKYEARGTQGVFIGCDSTTRSWKIYVPSNNTVHLSRDVIFDESRLWYHQSLQKNTISTQDNLFIEDHASETDQKLDLSFLPFLPKNSQVGEIQELRQPSFSSAESSQAPSTTISQSHSQEDVRMDVDLCLDDSLWTKISSYSSEVSPEQQKNNNQPSGSLKQVQNSSFPLLPAVPKTKRRRQVSPDPKITKNHHTIDQQAVNSSSKNSERFASAESSSTSPFQAICSDTSSLLRADGTQTTDSVTLPTTSAAEHSSLWDLSFCHAIPSTITTKEALCNKNWRQAMDREIASLQRLRVFSLKPRKPDMQVIGSRWVFAEKTAQEAHGQPTFKARFVGKGFQQAYGDNYTQTWAPTVSTNAIRAMVAVAAQHNYEIIHLDVHTAFLNAKLLEDNIYVEPPEGYFGKDVVLHLHRALYGLKQAGREWYLTLSKTLSTLGFTKSKSEPCLFFMHHSSSMTLIVTHVDDLLCAGTMTSLTTLSSQLSQVFKIKDAGPVTYALGIEFLHTSSGYKLTQTSYTTSLLEHFGYSNCKSSPTPMATTPSSQTKPSSLQDFKLNEIVGSLLWLSKTTRPDIAYATALLSQNVQTPTPSAYSMASRILRYLKGTITHGIHITSRSSLLELYADADWASDPSRKSHTGVIAFFGKAPIAWISKKQTSVALSSSEAELVAACEATKLCKFFLTLFAELKLPQQQPVTLYEDNSGTIHLANTSIRSKRLKHIDIKYQFINDEVRNGVIKLVKIPTELNVADILTKPLPLPKFRQFLPQLLASESSTLSSS